jgi:O-antigen/teichoic acid export membrane protein
MKSVLTHLKHSQSLISLVVMGMRMATLGAKFLLALFIARFMGLEALGWYGWIVGGSIVLPAMFRLGLFGTISRNAVTHSPQHLARDLTHYILVIGLLYTAATLVAIGAGVYLGLALLPLIILVVATEHLSFDAFNLFNTQSKHFRANVTFFVQGGAWILTFIAVAFMFPTLRTLEALVVMWLIGGLCACGVTAWGVKDLPWGKGLKKSLDKAWFASHFKKSYYFFITEITNTTAQYLDRYLIGLFLGIQQVGVYVLFWQVANAVYNLANTGVMQLYRARLIAACDSNNLPLFWQHFRACIARTLLSVVMLCAGVGLVMPFLLPYTNQPLAVQYLPLLWLAFAATIMRIGGDLAAWGLYAQRQDKIYAATFVLSLVLSAGLNLALIPTIGIWGPSCAQILLLIILIAIRWKYLKK